MVYRDCTKCKVCTKNCTNCRNSSKFRLRPRFSLVWSDCTEIARLLGFVRGRSFLYEDTRDAALLWWFWKRKTWQQFTNLFSLPSRTSHIWPPTSARWWVFIPICTWSWCMMIIAYLRFIIITIFIMSIMVTIIMIRRCSRTWASSLSSSPTTCPASPEEVTRCDFFWGVCLLLCAVGLINGYYCVDAEATRSSFVLPILRDIMVIYQ